MFSQQTAGLVVPIGEDDSLHLQPLWWRTLAFLHLSCFDQTSGRGQKQDQLADSSAAVASDALLAGSVKAGPSPANENANHMDFLRSRASQGITMLKLFAPAINSHLHLRQGAVDARLDAMSKVCTHPSSSPCVSFRTFINVGFL